ncbi:MAG: hypothetical protein RL204_1143 [Bacteroidota bacterium]
MKSAVLSIVCLLIAFSSRSQIWTEDFEVNALGTAYTSPSVFTNNSNAHYNRTNGTTISNTTAPYSNFHGTFYWAGENQNDNSISGDGQAIKTITFSNINILGQTALQFRGLFGTGNPTAGYDFNDAFYAEYRIDGGIWVKFIQFAAPSMSSNVGLRRDNNLDGIGEGVLLSPALQQFSANITASGTTIQFRITTINDGIGEEVAFDYLRLYNTSTSVLGCTNPSATNYSVTATVDNGSCLIPGCMDPTALNYNSNANSNNSSCVYTVPNIVINEIHYNPSIYAGFDDAVYEFVEIYNNTSSPINIAGWRIGYAVDYTFPTGTIIGANAFIVVAANAATYAGQGYPVYAFSGTLSNSGDIVQLVTNSNIVVDEVSYFPNPSWPTAPNGNGPSLQLINYNLDNSVAANWCASSANNGTPGNINSCYSAISGCTNNTALNYNPSAQTNDGSCIYAGCTYPDATNYNSLATVDDGSCIYDAGVLGCTYPNATNYNSLATVDDGSCIYDAGVQGCTYPDATNYNSLATVDDGSCIYDAGVLGCTYPDATNYNSLATVDDGSCIYDAGVLGCTYPDATNYNSLATVDDGSCVYDAGVLGCTYPNAVNYNSAATIDDGSCIYDAGVSGCTYPDATNYNSAATIDDGSCTYDAGVLGCTYPDATNYNSLAIVDDGTCIFLLSSTCNGDLNNDNLIGVSDLLIILSNFGNSCQ